MEILSPAHFLIRSSYAFKKEIILLGIVGTFPKENMTKIVNNYLKEKKTSQKTPEKILKELEKGQKRERRLAETEEHHKTL